MNMVKNKKKILFVTPNQAHGGTNKSLQNLLLEIDKDKYDVKVYSIRKGEWYQTVFEEYDIKRSLWVSLLFCNKLLPILIKKTSKCVYNRIVDFLLKKEALRLGRKYNFDIVISFEEGTATTMGSFFADAFKIAWIQCDYSQYIKLIDNSIEREKERIKYGEFNKIVCVSRATQHSMRVCYPNYSDKIVFAYNTLNVNYINELSRQAINDNLYDNSIFSLLSIGRFSPVKRFDKIPEIVEKIIKIGVNRLFRWYVIAPSDSKEYDKTINLINEKGLGSYVVLLGGKDNPYPYIKESNLLVCLSISESWSYVINEAKLLHTPVVTTDFPAAYEVVEDDTGIIVDYDSIPVVISNLINDTNGCYSSLKKTSRNYSYSNSLAVSMFNEVLGTF